MLKVNKTKYQKHWDCLILFLCGLLVFSPVSSHISLSILNLPLALPELLFLPFYPKVRKLFDLKVNLRILLIGSYLILFLIAISVLVGLFPFSSILSTARGYFYMLLFFSIFINKPIRNFDHIFYVVFGSSIGWMILGIFTFNQILHNTYSGESFAVYGNMIALGLTIAISIIYKKKMLSFITFGIVLIISMTAGLRRQIFISLAAFILSFFTQIGFSIKRFLTVSIVLVSITIALIQLYPVAKEFAVNVSPVIHTRLFVKSEQLIDGNLNEGDQNRLSAFKTFTNNMTNYILPKGFVSKRTNQDANTGQFMDSPYIELFHTLGLVFSLPIIFYFILSLHFHFKNYYRRKINESAVWLVMGSLIVILMLIEGSFLNFVYTTPITGFVFARLATRRNYIE